MRIISAFFALRGADRRLLLRAVAALLVVRAALAVLPLDRLRAWTRRLRPAGLPPGRPVERVVWALSAAVRRMPGATCLVSAFALQRLLAREGHESELHIGVARHDRRFAAHAWLVCEGRILIGEHESGDYTHLLAWRVNGSD